MKLIADAGSTKIEWCVIEGEHIEKQFKTLGLNAVMLSEEEITDRFREELTCKVAGYNIESAYYYGAGCVSPTVCHGVENALRKAVPTLKHAEAHSDLLAAARALLGNLPGIACILGTGSNSCFYDGAEIIENTSPLGWILGDEGSGAVLGKILVGDVLKKQLPEDLCEKFLQQYSLDRLEIIKRVYREPNPNRFLASLSPFLLENIERPEVKHLVINAFKSFFKRNIENYSESADFSINFVGSIACYYENELKAAASECGLTIGKIVQSPMKGLITYHSN